MMILAALVSHTEYKDIIKLIWINQAKMEFLSNLLKKNIDKCNEHNQ